MKRREFLKYSSLIIPASAVIGTINPFTKKIFAAEKNNKSFSLSVITDQPSKTIHLIEQVIKYSKYGKDNLQFTEYSLRDGHIGDIAYVKSQSLIDYHKATDEFSQSLCESANSLSLPKIMHDPVMLRFSSYQTLLEPDKVNIFRGDTLVSQLSLNKDLEHYRVEGLKGYIDVRVKEKSVKIISATCKHKTCMNMEPISKPGQNLICIPNQISLTVAGKSTSGVDSITF